MPFISAQPGCTFTALDGMPLWDLRVQGIPPEAVESYSTDQAFAPFRLPFFRKKICALKPGPGPESASHHPWWLLEREESSAQAGVQS